MVGLDEFVDKAAEEQKHIIGDQMLTDGTSTQNSIIIKDGNISFISNWCKVQTANDVGISIDGSEANTGSVVNKTNYGIMSDALTQELYIPSSIVTPLPTKFPLVQIAVQLVDIVADVIQGINMITQQLSNWGGNNG